MLRLELGLPTVEAAVPAALKAFVTQVNRCFQTSGSIHSQKSVHFCSPTMTEL